MKTSHIEQGARSWRYDYDAMLFQPHEADRSVKSLRDEMGTFDLIVHRSPTEGLSWIRFQRIEKLKDGYHIYVAHREWHAADFA